MSPIARFSAAFIVATVAVQTAVLAQGLGVSRHNPSEWTKGRFSLLGLVSQFGQLYRWFPSILKAITIVRPETLVQWHRAVFRRPFAE